MEQTTSPTVRLRRDAWAAWMTRLRIATFEEQAQHVGVRRTSLYRLLNGAPVGEQFIAGCLARFDGKFEDLFEVAS